MKRIIFYLAAPLVIFSACNKIDNAVETPDSRCDVRLYAGVGLQTKASLTPTDAESTCALVQFFAFREDGLIDAYGSTSTSKSLTLSCTTGSRTFYSVVNAPVLSGIASKTELLNTVSNLSDNKPGGLVMIGSVTGTLPDTRSFTIDVSRISARIRLKSITRAFTSTGLAAKSMKINRIYVSNAAAQSNYGLTLSPTTFYNKTTSYAEQPSLLSVTLDQNLEDKGSYSTVNSFYTYPNPGTTLKTRLVIVATVDGNVYYYPIELDKIEANKSYEIEKVTITRLGSTDPQVPVSVQDIQVTINVLGWDESSMTETI